MHANNKLIVCDLHLGINELMAVAEADFLLLEMRPLKMFLVSDCECN